MCVLYASQEEGQWVFQARDSDEKHPRFLTSTIELSIHRSTQEYNMVQSYLTAAPRQQVSDVFCIVYVGQIASGKGLHYIELLIT